MYGIWDAAQNWEECYVKALRDLVFTGGTASSCVFYFSKRDARVVVHGNGFTILASGTPAQCFVEQLVQIFDAKVKEIIGPGPSDEKQMHVLNRLVTWKDRGIWYEAKQRHADLIVKSLDQSDSRPVATPREKEEPREGDGQPLARDEACQCWGNVVRAK